MTLTWLTWLALISYVTSVTLHANLLTISAEHGTMRNMNDNHETYMI